MELVKVTKNGVLATDLYNFLFQNIDSPTPFNKWIRRRVNEYGFVEDIDFQTFLSKSTGGRKLTDFAMTIDMAKELSMVEKTDIGRRARKYFIKCEKIARRTEAVRLAGIETRKTLTDKIDDSNENDRMHGHAYSTYTKFAYKLCGINYIKQDNFRDTLTADQLRQVENAEGMIKSMLDMGKEYQEIKGMLSPIFEIKGVK